MSGEAPPSCPHGERCAGCPLLGMPYEGQLEHKGAIVREALGGYRVLAGLEPGAAEGASPVLGYRTRAKWVVAPGPRVGMYAKGKGHEVVDVPGCLVAAPSLLRAAEALRELLREGGDFGRWFAPFDGRGPGALKAVDLRRVDGEGGERVLATLVLERERAPAVEAFRPLAEAWAGRAHEIAGVAMNLSSGSSPQVLGPETVHAWGATGATFRVGEVETVASFGAFVQAHGGQAARLQRKVLELGRGAKRALDLYGGSGVFGLALARAGSTVDLVETLPSAAASAHTAAQASGLALRALAGDAEKLLGMLIEAGEAYDLIVVNPPRRGLAPGVRRQLGALAPSKLAYVSCDPRTLGRDLDHLARLGLGASSLRPVDMMPLTDQVECFVALSPARPPSPEVLFENDEIVVVNKAPHEPTSPQGEYMGSLLGRVRGLSGCGSAVPAHGLDAGASGVSVFVRRASSLSAWASALAAPGAVETYTALARGVCPSHGTVKRPLQDGARKHEARTRFRRLGVVGGHSLLSAVPEPGRNHQVRRHLAMSGHPLLGDGRYGDGATNRHFFEAHGLDRPFLHRARLALADSPSGPLTFEAPLAPDLEASLRSLERAAAGAARKGAPAHQPAKPQP